MAFTLRNALEKQKGGMIGVTIDGKQKWFEENDFMKLFEKDGTKEVLVDAIKYGRDPGSRPKKEIPDLRPKADISETRDQMPEEWDESESFAVFNKAQHDAAIPSPNEWDESEPETARNSSSFNRAQQDKAASSQIPPKPTPEQLARQQIEEKATTSPYGREEETEAITSKNFPIFEKRSREAFRNHMKKYDFLNTLTPQDAAKRKIADSEEEWFDEFAQRHGLSLQHALLDDYKKDKDPEMKEFLYDWQKFLTKNKEAIYDLTNKKFLGAQQSKKEETYQFEQDMGAQRGKVLEQGEAEREEAKKYTPEKRVKDMKALAKAKRGIADAEAEGDKPEVAALTAEIKLLEERLGVGGTTEETEPEGDKTSGFRKEAEMRALLLKRGYPPPEGDKTSGFRKEAEMRALLLKRGYPPGEIDKIINSPKLKAAIEAKAREKQ